MSHDAASIRDIRSLGAEVGPLDHPRFFVGYFGA
jgi:hypothetical protein